MRTDRLEKHITDTVKEWQLKIGLQQGDMKLYYPAHSLALLLEEENLSQALEAFAREVKTRLGEVKITAAKDDRYCVSIPQEGCRYIEEQVPDPELLKNLLAIVTTPGKTMEDVQQCFDSYAKEQQTKAISKNEASHGLGRIFYFEDEAADAYVYCVEENEFGLTYHRFSREDYEELQA